MKTVFTLTSAESRRLIAKAVVAMPEFKKAWESAYLLLAGGTTNAFIAQELLGRDGIEPDAALSASAPMAALRHQSRQPQELSERVLQGRKIRQDAGRGAG